MFSDDMESFLGKFGKMFMRRRENVLGIDIGTRTLKVVEMGFGKGRSVLQKVAIADLPESIMEDGQIADTGALVDILRQVLYKNGMDSKEAVVAIGGRTVFMRELTFPKMTRKELQEAIKWDMEKYVPFAPDTFYYDFSIIENTGVGAEMKVFLAAAAKDMIHNVLEVVQSAGITPVVVDIEPLALYRSLRHAENSLIVDVGGNASQVVIFQEGTPHITRAVPIHGRAFTEGIMRVLDLDYMEAELLKQRQRAMLKRPDEGEEESLLYRQMADLAADMAREIQRTVEYYQIQNKQAIINKVFLAGGGARFENLAQHLAGLLDMPVFLHSPFEKVEIGAAFDKQYLQAHAPQLAMAIGLALRGGEL